MKARHGASSLAVAARPPLEEYSRRRERPPKAARARGFLTPSSYARIISIGACVLLIGWLLVVSSRASRVEAEVAHGLETSHVAAIGAAAAASRFGGRSSSVLTEAC